MDWLVDLLTYSGGQLIDLLTNAVTFSAGALTGFLLGLLGAHIERRWRRKDVRAAEKRARLDEGFQQVRNYAAAICEFVFGTPAWMIVWNDHRSSEGREACAQFIREDIQNSWQRLEKLEPAPSPRFGLHDDEVWSLVAELESLAEGCKDGCLDFLDTGQPADVQVSRNWGAKADERLAYIFRRMTEMLDAVE